MQLNRVKYTPLRNIWWHKAISGKSGDAGGVQQAIEIRDRTSLCSQGRAGGSWEPLLELKLILKHQLITNEHFYNLRNVKISSWSENFIEAEWIVSVQNFKRHTFYYEGERLKEGKKRTAHTQTPICPTQWSRCRNGCVSTAVCSALGGREEI